MRTMRKIKLTVFTLAVILGFASCNGLFSPIKETSSKAKVSFSCYVSENSVVRTILPSIDLETAGYTYSITGTKNGTGEDFATDISFSDFATTSKEIDPGIWTFIITAYDASNTAILSGSVTENITGGVQKVSIVLGAASGTGSASVTLNFPNGKGISKVTAALYDSPIAQDDGDEQTITDNSNGTSSVVYTNNSIPTGSAKFIKFFLYDVNNVCIGSYVESLYAFPGMTSEKAVTVNEINTFAVAVNLNKDYAEWNDSGKTITLRKDGLEYTLTQGDGSNAFTGSVPVGNYDVFCNGNPTCVEVNTTGFVGTSENTVNLLYATQDTVWGVMNNISDYKSYTVKITGTINNGIIGTISSALDKAGGLINLDFSESTGLTEVGGWSLQWKGRIQGVIFPDGLETLGPCCFINCHNNKFVKIPASVTKIEYAAFSAPSQIKEIIIDENNKNYKVVDKKMILTKDGKTVVSASNLSGDITIPDGVETLLGSSFEGELLRSVTLPDGLKVIEGNTFANQGNLKSINIPSSVVEIRDGVFSNCKKLTEIEADPNNEVYASSSNGQMLLLKDGKTLVSYPSAPSNLVIPDEITGIAETAFSGASDLTKIVINANVSEIGRSAFAGCKQAVFEVDAVNRYFKASDDGKMLLSKDGKTLVSWPSAKDDENIPEGIEHIGDGALASCDYISNVTFPTTLKSLGNEPIAGQWSGSTIITLKSETPPTAESSITWSCSIKKILVPESAIGKYKAASVWGDSDWSDHGNKIAKIHEHTKDFYSWGDSYHYYRITCNICGIYGSSYSEPHSWTWDDASNRYTCFCGATTECTHNYERYYVPQDGYDRHEVHDRCSKCGEDNHRGSEQHNWSGDAGNYTCSLCGETSNHLHNWVKQYNNNWVDSSSHYYRDQCSICGCLKYDGYYVESHNYDVETQGYDDAYHYNMQVCTDCGYENRWNETEHTWTENVSGTGYICSCGATTDHIHNYIKHCSNIDNFEYHETYEECSICQSKKYGSTEYHTFELVYENIDDDHHYQKYTCSACGYVHYTYETHYYYEKTYSTHNESNHYVIRECICGYRYSPYEDYHEWNEGTVTTEPTCTDKGIKTYTCTKCGETINEDIPATGHAFSDEWTANELYHWHEATCGHSVTSEKLVHTWDDGVDDVVSGGKEYTCQDCGRKEIKTVSAFTVSFVSGDIDITLTKFGNTGNEFTATLDGATKFTWTFNNSPLSETAATCDITSKLTGLAPGYYDLTVQAEKDGIIYFALYKVTVKN